MLAKLQSKRIFWLLLGKAYTVVPTTENSIEIPEQGKIWNSVAPRCLWKSKKHCIKVILGFEAVQLMYMKQLNLGNGLYFDHRRMEKRKYGICLKNTAFYSIVKAYISGICREMDALWDHST